jgi:hypothetical protein
VEQSSLDEETTSVTSFLDAVLGIPGDLILFRGHRCCSWPLRPTLARMRRRGSATMLDTERDLLNEFTIRSAPFLDAVGSSRDLDLLATAQHHGLATRLLDWTSNPLVALWFAVRQSALDGEAGVIFAFPPTSADIARPIVDSPFDVTRTKFFRPRHRNPRVIAQDGWFSVHTLNRKQDDFVDMSHVIEYKARLRRVLVAADAFSIIRHDLDRLGVNEATLFPGLDGLSRHLNWLNTTLEDES